MSYIVEYKGYKIEFERGNYIARLPYGIAKASSLAEIKRLIDGFTNV